MNPFIIGGNRGVKIPFSLCINEPILFIGVFLRLLGQYCLFPSVSSGKTSVTPAFLVVTPGKTIVSSAILVGKAEETTVTPEETNVTAEETAVINKFKS